MKAKSILLVEDNPQDEMLNWLATNQPPPDA